MSKESKKRKKKWKKEEIKKEILKYLAEKEEATKYKIMKDLEIPLSTILQAIGDLEEDGLIEYEIGKRESHICRLTFKGLLNSLKKGTIGFDLGKKVFSKMIEEKIEQLSLKDIKSYIEIVLENRIELEEEFELAKKAFFKIIRIENINRLLKELNMTEKELSAFIKSYLRYSKAFDNIFKVSDDVEDNIEKLIINWEMIARFFLWEVIQDFQVDIISLEPIKHINYNWLSQDEVEAFYNYIARNAVDLFIPFDYLKHYLASMRDQACIIENWIFFGCKFLKFEFNLNWDEIIKLIKEGACMIKLEFKKPIIEIKTESCPLDGKICNVEDFLDCEKIKRLFELGNLSSYRRDVNKK